MRAGRNARKRLWRWRSNPLRRHDDVIEAWIVLAAGAVIAVGGTVAGLVTAHTADEVFARQRAERQPVRAVLVTDAPASGPATWGAGTQARATVRWAAPDGRVRTGPTLVDTGSKAGTGVEVWQDGRGRLTNPPTESTEAAVESAVLAIGAAGAVAALTLGAGALARWRLDRRRIDSWGQEWDLVGPRWGHKTG
ncbi:Rv1733c family protein [Streptomyces brasiliensis]|uniref:Uncharacterized protein n=1 Tax=Streptomyces brasiliensis TaxID=1954 RepID=A0A917KAC1_9ACTN|nr:hypothetical protein [Streptomyces brasiliensis]GGJ06641.1 hypothetical protein GCM10010121_016420 [Streptomyces brasiliensis]